MHAEHDGMGEGWWRRLGPALLGGWLLAQAMAAPACAGTWALVAGIDDYPAFGALQRSRAGARALAAALVRDGGLPPGNVVLMTDDAEDAARLPTLVNLREQMQGCVVRAQPGDTLLVAFLGHGISHPAGKDGFLVPMEGMGSGGWSVRSIVEAARRGKGLKLVLLLDVGHSDSTARGVAAPLAQWTEPDAAILLAAGSQDVSYDDARGPHTLYVAAVLKALAERPGGEEMTVAALHGAVAGDVQASAFAQGHLQRPVLVGGSAVDLVLLPAVTRDAAAVDGSPRAGTAFGVPGLELGMVPMPPGTFQMGGDGGDANEVPVHTVTLTRPFWVARTEVTREQYAQVTGAAAPPEAERRLPVEAVSWEEAVAFCAGLTRREAAAGRLPAGCVFRLPTEAEWEYVCRAGTVTRFSFGDDFHDLYRYGNCAAGSREGRPWAAPRHDDGFPAAAPVASFLANPWGVHDLHGNVAEWCGDWYDAYPVAAQQDPAGPAVGFYRVCRGASYWDHPYQARSRNRGLFTPQFRAPGLGFRVVLGPVPSGAAGVTP